MSRLRPIVTIDGPAGAGKSTVSRALAERLGFVYLDTGAIYRTVALAAQEAGLAASIDAAAAPEAVEAGVREALRRIAAGLAIEFAGAGRRVLLAGRDVSEAIRHPEVGSRASKVSALPEVRAELLGLQRRLGAAGGIVAEGRDIGTVVFPDAEVKIFLTATPAERARRRVGDLRARGIEADEAAVRDEIEARDRRDSGRAVAPLACPPGALVIDSTAMSADAVIARMVDAVTACKPA